MKFSRLSLIRVAAAAAVTAAAGAVGALTGTTARPAFAAAGSTSGAPGYWLAASDGGMYGFDAPIYGSKRGQALNKPVVGMAATTNGLGYWMVASDGGIFNYGDAGFFGSTGGMRLNQPVVGMAEDPATGGYWLVAADGGVFPFNAPFYGSTGAIHLNKPIVGMASTPDGLGYWLVASDGGVFNFGDANFYGSTGNIPLNKPVVGMGANPIGKGPAEGYWLVAADGGIFPFGNALYEGSTGGMKLNKPIVGMAPTANGNGYWLAASDGGVFTFGNAAYLGSTGGHPGPAPIVAIASTDNGYPFPPGSTGYDISKWQCSSLPPQAQVSIVEIAGAVNGYQNPCYTQEAAWAGSAISSYIYMNPLPSPAPSESMSGPAGNCSSSDNTCQAYNFGSYWAQHWVAVSHSLGVFPNLWWLDVEAPSNWPTSAQGQAQNAKEIAGAVYGLGAAGVAAGIYSTNYQWSQITGSGVSFPGIALWIPGASNIYTGTYSAQNFCNGTVPGSYGWEYAPFAGGKPVLVQYGWGSEYTGPPSNYDQDYACP